MRKASFTQEISKREDFTRFPVSPPRRWRNGLIVRMPNHLGDAVMALPALMQLKKIIPENCALFVITPAYMREFYEALPDYVDGIIPLSKMHSFWSWEEIKEIRQLRCGVAVLFNHSPRDTFALRLAGIPEVYGAAARGRSFMLTRSFKFGKRTPGDPKGTHQTMRYLSIAYALGAPQWHGELPDFKVPVSPCELDYDISHLCRHPQLLLLAAGAAYGAAKRWPAENFAAVARYWIRHGGIVAVMGSKGEFEIGEAVISQLPKNKCVNLCGKTGMFALIHLFRTCCCCVGNDSGLMHLGAILNSHGIVPFGPTDFTDTGPVTPAWRIISEQPQCAPCLKHTCPLQEKYCMKVLTASRIIRELHSMIKEYHFPFRKQKTN